MVEHVVEKTDNNGTEKSTPKLNKTFLNTFSKVINTKSSVRVKSSVNLVQTLCDTDLKNDNDEVNYALNRMVRGLGSSTSAARTGYYTTLVAFLNSKGTLTVGDIFQCVEKELHNAGSNSKGENADIFTGHVLAMGAIIRSNLYANSSQEEQKKVVEFMVTSAKRRTYLSFLANSFLISLCDLLTQDEFKAVVFPIIKDDLKLKMEMQNLDSLYLLLYLKHKFPAVISKKFLQSSLGSSSLLCPENCDDVASVLTTTLRITAIKHPIYSEIAKELATSPHLEELVSALDRQIERPNRNKQLIVTNLLANMLPHINASQVCLLIPNNLITYTLHYLKSLRIGEKDPDFHQYLNKYFDAILSALKKDDVKSDIKVAVIRKLLLSPGTFIFEKITKTKIVQQITLTLDGDGLKSLAKIYQSVVLGNYLDNSNETWYNNDRLYAAHMLVKLLGYAPLQTQIEWKIEQLLFLMELGLLKQEKVGMELAASLKTAFFNSLDTRVPKLEDLHQVLESLLTKINEKLSKDNLEEVLRSPISQDNYELIQKVLKKVKSLKAHKNKNVKSVFLTLFLHMGLQLFNDANLATDALNELFSCYKRFDKKSSNEAEEQDDPLWIEVVVDLFLNLLSQNSSLLRSVIRCVFPHLCQYLNGTAIHQILSVIHSEDGENPLLNANDSSGESEDEEEEDDDDDESVDDEEKSDSEEEEEEIDAENITANEKLRMALQNALLKTNQEDDGQSIDLDDLSDTEGEKLNETLGEIFKQYRPNHGRRKKQSKSEEALTHFRTRVLDLIEIYLDSNPSMLLTLEIMLPLLYAVESSVKDVHQKPFLSRLKICLKKLSQTKKFGNVTDVTGQLLQDLLKSLLEKGTKNMAVVQDMSEQISDCCLFIIRCSQLIVQPKKKKHQKLQDFLATTVSDQLQLFFTKRECITPYALFKNVFQLHWNGNLQLVSLVFSYCFNDEVKAFKKNQALELLKVFYSNHRFISANSDLVKQQLEDDHQQFSDNIKSLFKSLSKNPKQKITEKYLSNWFNLLSAIKSCPVQFENIKFTSIIKYIKEYRSHLTLSNDAKSAYKKLCNQLGVPPSVEMKTALIKLSTLNNNADNVSKKEKRIDQTRKTSDLKEKRKLKKESKSLRLLGLSEGFHTNLNFDHVKHDDQNMNGDQVEDGTQEISPKRKKLLISDDEKPSKKIKNGSC